jgi:release factor glutamine methyltransferase
MITLSTVFKNIVTHTYKPLVVKYLSKKRVYHYKDTRLEIPPEVFHPGFFFSTQLLLQYLLTLPLQQQRFLELGCGSGLISIIAAKQNAEVTATDINPIAIASLISNSRQNHVSINIIESDLFKAIPPQQFDIIAINPPYYKKQPQQPKDYAWYCGEQGEYFEQLFKSLRTYSHSGTEILMVLFKGCDMDMIDAFAAKNNFILRCMYSKKNMLEENFIFKIENHQ